MKDQQNENQKVDGDNRRAFLKTISATAVAGGLGLNQSARAQEVKPQTFPPKTPPPFPPPYSKKLKSNQESDWHVCRGLNTTGDNPGTCDGPNLKPGTEHGCAGGNTCAGLGGCGTGDYATQYWVSENLCGKSGSAWTGSGGCGVPLGSTNTGFICSQLNNAVPVPTEKDPEPVSKLLGMPVWAIARARFEAKMAAAKTRFGNKDKDGKQIFCGEYKANAWDGNGKFTPDPKNKIPSDDPYPKPIPDRPEPS